MILLLGLASILLTTGSGCKLHPDRVYNGTFADCSRRNLSGIPTDLPANTTSLDLSNNNFSVFHLPKNVTFNSLHYLDISHNKLSALESRTFMRFGALRELYINNNNLTLDRSYPDDVFQPLHNLLKLHLHNNDQRDVGSYPEKAMGKLTSIEELKIDTFMKTHFGFGFTQLSNLKRLILGFHGCKLRDIQNRTFDAFSNVSLHVVDLDRCPVGKLETGSFLPLLHLKKLTLSNTYVLDPTTAMLAMYGLRGKHLSSIEMNSISSVKNYRTERPEKRILSNDVMVHMKDVCVGKLTLINNQLLWIGNDVFVKGVFAKCIKYLDLSMNDFYGDTKGLFEIGLLSNLVYLNLSSFSERKSNHINYTGQPKPRTIGFPCTDSLRMLDVNGFYRGNFWLFTDVHFYNTTSLHYVSIANIGLSYIKGNIFGLEKITSLDMSSNYFSGVNINLFEFFPSLESLTLADVDFDDGFLFEYGEKFLHPVKQLKRINLSKNNIRLLHANIFSSNHMECIIISYNRFETIPFDLTTTPNLHHLDLSFNSLAVLSDEEMKLLDLFASRHNLTLNLEGNLLSCGCQNLDFILWLLSTNVQLIRPTEYRCQMSDGSIINVTYIRDHYEEIWLSCFGGISLAITVAILAVLLLIILVMYLTIRQKTKFVNIFLRMFGYGPLPRTLTRADFVNDAYIGYSDADYQFICHTVRDHLETRHGLRLFIRDRDTIPGGQIADDIISGIDSSWRTVLFLTAAFLDDEWCQFIINRVVYSSGRLPQGSVILVLFDDVNRGNIDPSLLNVLVERNIFPAARYRRDEDRLWKEVSDRIKEDAMQ